MAESTATLPVCIVLSALLWWMGSGLSPLNVAGWGDCLLTTYVLAEMDNEQQLIRIRSRLLPCVWLFVASSIAVLHPLVEVQLPAFCLSMAYFLLLRCYQHYEPVGHVFHCFLFLSVGSLFFVPMLALFVPMLCYLWWLMFVRTWRTFWAALLGITLPYVIWGCWCLITERYEPFIAHFLPFHRIPWTDSGIYAHLLSPQLIPFVFIVLLMLLGTVHHLTSPFADKIRVRLMLRIFIFQSLLFMVLPAVLPDCLPVVTAFLLVSSAPLIAHFFALVGNKYTNILFLAAILICITLSIAL